MNEYTFHYEIRFKRRKSFTPLMFTVKADDIKTASKRFADYITYNWNPLDCSEIKYKETSIKIANDYVTWNCIFKEQ